MCYFAFGGIFTNEHFCSVFSSKPWNDLLVTGSRRLAMSYLVRAEIEKPNSGTFKTEAETKCEAIEKAQRLRSEGLVVRITDPTGRTVDETNAPT
jgi:hypothetical protein